MIRTTYWTRKNPERRPDELEDAKILSSGKDNEAASFEKEDFELMAKHSNMNRSSDASVTSMSKKQKLIKHLLSLLCGFETVDNKAKEMRLELQKRIELKKRLESFNSLNQKKVEKYILNANLAIILLIATGLFIFFSIPPQLHIFKHIDLNLNQTSH